MVQNYRYLNKWTIKNNYPLSFISDIVENIGIKKMFTKLDLRWKLLWQPLVTKTNNHTSSKTLSRLSK